MIFRRVNASRAVAYILRRKSSLAPVAAAALATARADARDRLVGAVDNKRSLKNRWLLRHTPEPLKCDDAAYIR